ncbi:MAG: helix-turn-helix transcriptional regulator, partial [Candidatus Eisenbacteria bacterium]
RTRYLPAEVEILLAEGKVDEAREAAEELERIAAASGVAILGGIAAHARGAVLLAEGDARGALAPLRHALESWRSVEAPYLAARIRVLIGHACRALGDEEGARLECDAARAVFAELGAAPDLARLEAPATGEPARATSGLTARELQVLRLLARGGTNKAMAAELFLSEKTVDRHVSNIFAKLGVATRAAATAHAYDHGLL